MRRCAGGGPGSSNGPAVFPSGLVERSSRGLDPPAGSGHGPKAADGGRRSVGDRIKNITLTVKQNKVGYFNQRDNKKITGECGRGFNNDL